MMRLVAAKFREAKRQSLYKLADFAAEVPKATV